MGIIYRAFFHQFSAWLNGLTWFLTAFQYSDFPYNLTWILVGMYLWEAIEYASHRWLLHNATSYYYFIHGYHHKQPHIMHRQHIPLPFFYAIALPIYTLLTLLLPSKQVSAVVTGCSLSYLLFESVHYLCHVPGSNCSEVCKYHMQHHRFQFYNYSFTCTFIDYWLGSLKLSRKYIIRGVPLAVKLPLPPLLNFLLLELDKIKIKHSFYSLFEAEKGMI